MTSTIGGNKPPPDTLHSLKADEMLSLVSDTLSGAEVTTDAQETALDDILIEARAAKKAAEADRVAEKKPHDDAAEAVQAKYKPIIGKFDAVMDEIKAKLTPYRQAKQAAKEAAAQKAREEAEAKEREAQQALKQSDDLESRFEAEENLKSARKLTAVANRIDRSKTGLRTSQKAVLTDRRKLLEYVMRHDPEPLTEWLQEYAQKALPSKLPGVDIETVKVAA